MNKKFLLVLVLLLVAGFLVNGYLLAVKEKKTIDPSAVIQENDSLVAAEQNNIATDQNIEAGSEANQPEDKMMAKSYSLADVSAHATPDDCWLVIDAKVYDVTSYIEKGIHPGGEAILFGCGKDATEMFKNRPNGSGSHSERAFSFLDNFYIGNLD